MIHAEFPNKQQFQENSYNETPLGMWLCCLVACCSYHQVTCTTVTKLSSSVLFFSKTSKATLIWTVSLNVTICKDSIRMNRLKCVCLLQHANEDVERMLLGNKCDMEDKRIVPKAKGEQVRDYGWLRMVNLSISF